LPREPFDRFQYRAQADIARCRVDRAQRAEKGAVGKEDRDRDVALETVHDRGVMHAPARFLADMIDHHAVAAVADFVADRRFDVEFVARLEPEGEVVAHLARDPAMLGHPCDGSEAHAGQATHFVEDRTDAVDRLDRGDVSCKILARHARPFVT
jgi:hypothetical protein